MAFPLTPHQIRQIAVLAKVDPRTVASRLAGRKVLPATADAIERAMKDLGLVAPSSKEGT